MNRRKFLSRAGIATVVSSAGVAGCLGGGDGGDGDGSGGDGSDGSNGSDGSDGGDGSNNGGGDGSGDGGATATPTQSPTESPTQSPTPTATVASGGSLGAGARAPYDDWASPSVYGSGDVDGSTVDLQTLQELSQSNTGTPTPTPRGTQVSTDPIVGYPLSFLFVAAFSGLALAPFNLGNLTSQGASAERINTVGNGLVFGGSYDVESLRGRVAESQASEAGSYEGYTLYSQGSGDSRSVIGVSSEALVHASSGEQVSDPRALVEATIDAGAGNAPSYGSEHGAYEDLVTALPVQPIMGLVYSPDGAVRQGTPTPTPQPGGGGEDFFNISQFDLEGKLNGFASGLGFDAEQQSATASMALRYTSASEVDARDLIRSQAAPQASQVSVQVSGPLVRISASYSESPNL